MKISAFILSFCGFCVFYICNADWIDELIENYLGSEYEEIAPFVPSVTAGTEEFDRMVREFGRSSRRRWLSPVVLATALCCLSLSVLLPCRVLHAFRGREAVKTLVEFLVNFRKSEADREEIRTIVSEFLERKLKQLCRSKRPDDVPVKLLWKGGTLVESSVHCNIRDESKLQHVQRHLLHPKLPFDPSVGRGEKTMLAPSCSETSTARKMAEIRQLLESEQELEKFRDEGAEKTERRTSFSFRERRRASEDDDDDDDDAARTPEDGPRERNRQSKGKEETDAEGDYAPDPKLMNRIRLLENRLRLEELKNKNWINRMMKAEGILQQLNKQVERIEESQPMGTLTETLKITSTTNWATAPPPRRNAQFTLVNQYPLFCLRTPYASLSELIAKEVGLPSSDGFSKSLLRLPPTPQLPALPSPTVMPQSSFLSKFLCR